MTKFIIWIPYKPRRNSPHNEYQRRAFHRLCMAATRVEQREANISLAFFSAVSWVSDRLVPTPISTPFSSQMIPFLEMDFCANWPLFFLKYVLFSLDALLQSSLLSHDCFLWQYIRVLFCKVVFHFVARQSPDLRLKLFSFTYMSKIYSNIIIIDMRTKVSP